MNLEVERYEGELRELRKAARKALEALNSCSQEETYEGEWLNYYEEQLVRDATRALKQALRQPEEILR